MSRHCVGVFKYLAQCHCPGWGHLNEKNDEMTEHDTHTDTRTQPFIVKDITCYF